MTKTKPIKDEGKRPKAEQPEMVRVERFYLHKDTITELARSLQMKVIGVSVLGARLSAEDKLAGLVLSRIDDPSCLNRETQEFLSSVREIAERKQVNSKEGKRDKGAKKVSKAGGRRPSR